MSERTEDRVIDRRLVERTISGMQARMVAVDWTDPKYPVVTPISDPDEMRSCNPQSRTEARWCTAPYGVQP